MATKRLLKELRDIQERQSPYFSATPVCPDTDLFVWRALIHGPEGSPYEGGLFPLSIRFPSNYPFRPPKVAFLVNIYHPGIDNYGRNCLDILDHIFWSPAMTTARVLESLMMLLAQPVPDDPLMVEIAKELANHPERFDRTARKWTLMFASPQSELSRMEFLTH
ncbi:hypothetical protein BG006_002900 [Podila minutissima]|uniref:UBC core domain-containing protein n=1 Tax=Podila minutissima TaxID=64525 RepID=A0A9P5SSC1_9FUNG|nr:hypothetical protein BG006_002900 [Podila minutissima]